MTAMMVLLMVIDDLHVRGAGRVFAPFEANPPAVVDADAVLTLSVPFQPFKMVAGQRRKVFERDCRFQTVQLQPGGAFDARERLDALAAREVPGSPVPIADDHK